MPATVHPAPSPALHTLNTPELLPHDAAHPDNLVTSATLVPGGIPSPGPGYTAALIKPEISGFTECTDNQHPHKWTFSSFYGGAL